MPICIALNCFNLSYAQLAAIKSKVALTALTATVACHAVGLGTAPSCKVSPAMLPVLASFHTLALPSACMCAELQLTIGLPPDTSPGQRQTDCCIKTMEVSCQIDDHICMHASSSLSLEILAGQRCIHKRVACAGPLRSKTCLSQMWYQTTTVVQGLLAQKTCECVTLQPVISLSKQTHVA